MNRSIEQCIIKNSLHQSHELISKAVKPGDAVIDATAGNGGDTVFLAGLVGPSGKVWSFDIQKQANEKTFDKLKTSGLDSIVAQISDSHSNMDEYVHEEQVLAFVRTIDCKQFTVSQTEFVNQINCPPILICIEKLYK